MKMAEKSFRKQNSPLSGALVMSLKAERSQNVFHSQTLSPSASSTLTELSPPSTPSQLMPFPVPPLYTSSPSHASSPMYPTHSKSQSFCEDHTGNKQLAPQQTCTQSDMSSTCGPCHGTYMPMPTTPEVTIARASLECVSLEQHLQHSNTGREEAMQSFILERFLPAAKVVATDHDRTLYTASKQHALKPSMTSHMSIPKSTKNTSRLHSIPSTSSASKGVRWSSPVSRDEGETDDEEPAKSSGFFCVGLKTAISRVHKVVHPSAHSMSRSKSRAAPLSSQEASSDEKEDVLPKVNASAQCTQKRWNGHATASYAFSSSSPTIETIHRGRSSRCMASSRNSLPISGFVGGDGSPFVSPTSLDATPLHNMVVNCHSHQEFFSSISPTIETIHQGRSSRCMASSRNSLPKNGCVGQDGSPFVSPTSLDVTPLHNMAVNCHSINPLHQQFRCNCSKQSPVSRSCLRPPCDQSCASCHCEHGKESPGGTRLKENASRCIASDVSVQGPASKASFNGSTVHQDAVQGALGVPDYTEDDEHEFYDAFDSWSSIPGNVTPLTCTSPKSPKTSGSSRNDEHVPSYIETPHAFDITSKISGCDAGFEGLSKNFLEKQEEMEGKESSTRCLSCGSAGSAHTAAPKQNHRKIQADQGKESFSRSKNDTYSSNPSSARKIFDPKSESGTPNGNKKWLSPPEQPGWPLGISSVQSGTKKSSFQEQTNHDDRCAANLVSAFTESSVLSSPPVPPSPTGSWLGKAMALNASKPSTLATLQQKEKAVSARKKLEFTLSDAKKEVKWEDVVKGGQMHPEGFRFSEELRHRHPSNRNAVKPLRL